MVAKARKTVEQPLTSAQKQAAKKVADAAERKKEREKPIEPDSEEESEEESEDLEELEVKIKADQARLAAKKAAKSPPTKLALLEAKLAILLEAVDNERKVMKLPKTATKTATVPGMEGKVLSKKKKREESEEDDDLFNLDASSDSEASIGEKEMPSSNGKKLEKAIILSSYRKELKNLPEKDKEPMRLTLRLLKRSEIDDAAPTGQIVLEGFVDELQRITLTSKYGAPVAASVRTLQCGDASGGQVSNKLLRQALAEQKAMAEFNPPKSGNDLAAPHRRGSEEKVPRKKTPKKDPRVGKKELEKRQAGKGVTCYTCGATGHTSRECPQSFANKKKEKD